MSSKSVCGDVQKCRKISPIRRKKKKKNRRTKICGSVENSKKYPLRIQKKNKKKGIRVSDFVSSKLKKQIEKSQQQNDEGLFRAAYLLYEDFRNFIQNLCFQQ